MDKQIILNTDKNAAEYRTDISGWVSRDGIFFGKDERTARWSGCTHVKCEDCGEPVEKSRLVCNKCHDNRLIKKHEQLPVKEWDETGMLYSTALEKYYSSWDETECDTEEYGISMKDMLLVICKPQYLHQIDTDIWCDDLPDESDELPDEVEIALEKLNTAIRNAPPVSYYPDKYAAKIEQTSPSPEELEKKVGEIVLDAIRFARIDEERHSYAYYARQILSLCQPSPDKVREFTISISIDVIEQIEKACKHYSVSLYGKELQGDGAVGNAIKKLYEYAEG